MNRRPLILSPETDINALAVAWGLGHLGIEPIISPTLCDPALGATSLHGDADSPWHAGGGLDGQKIGAIWNRRPRDPQHFPGVHANDVSFVRDEWILFQRNVYALCGELSDSLWINDPTAADRCENKLVQLAAARRCGVSFPATLVSNDPAEIRRFIGRHGRVVYKSFMPHAWRVAETGQAYAFYVRTLDAESDLNDGSLALCPGIYQVYVEKTHDLRVTVIGDRFFTVALHSDTSGEEVDWRVHSFTPGLRAEACALPAAYEDRLRTLMRELGIVFGCIDLAVDAEGGLHFLEVNQGGQFLFIEEQLADRSLPMLRAMCAFLAQGRTDYSLDSMPEFTYAEYLRTEGHRRWYETAMRTRQTAISGAREQTPASASRRGLTIE